MKKIRISVLLASFLSLTAFAATPDPEVRNALRSIHTATGQNAWDRIRSCRIKFSDGSWVETASTDQLQIEAHKGDLILEVYLDLPKAPGSDGNNRYTDLTARWVIRNGQAMPESGWAKEIQNKPRPLRSVAWLDC